MVPEYIAMKNMISLKSVEFNFDQSLILDQTEFIDSNIGNSINSIEGLGYYFLFAYWQVILSISLAYLLSLVIYNKKAHVRLIRLILGFKESFPAHEVVKNDKKFKLIVENALNTDKLGTELNIAVLKFGGIQNQNYQLSESYRKKIFDKIYTRLKKYIYLDNRNRMFRTGISEVSFLIYGKTRKDITKDITSIFNLPFEFGHLTLKIHACIGFAQKIGIEKNVNDLIMCAKIGSQNALELEEGNNKNINISKKNDNRIDVIEKDIHRAIKENQVKAVYQPQFEISSGKMVGMEALARWTHPVLGFIPPPEFINVAEQIGMIVPLGHHMLRVACNDAVSMRGSPTVSVNLSVLQIMQDDILTITEEILDSTGLPANRLKYEITETALIQETDLVFEVLSKLKKIGVAISLDDFGTGYSTLSYLTDFDWDELKVDKSFVSKAMQCSKMRHLAEAIVALTREFNICLTIEGIETNKQRDLFSTMGYRVAQGFYYAKPMCFEKLNKSPYVLTGIR